MLQARALVSALRGRSLGELTHLPGSVPACAESLQSQPPLHSADTECADESTSGRSEAQSRSHARGWRAAQTAECLTSAQPSAQSASQRSAASVPSRSWHHPSYALSACGQSLSPLPSASGTHHSVAGLRLASTLTRTGVPNPRPEYESTMSTAKGGHIARAITFTQTLNELAQFIAKNQESFQNVHWAAAALQLEKLTKQQQAATTGLRVKGIASKIETATGATAYRLAAIHLASVLRGLTGAQHAMSHTTLTAFAASLISRDCAQLRLANDAQWKHIVQGFALQGYANPVLWRELSQVALDQLPSWEPNRTASIVCNMAMMGVRHQPLLNAAMEHIRQKVDKLTPGSVASALHTLSVTTRPPSNTTDIQPDTANSAAPTTNTTDTSATGAPSFADGSLEQRYMTALISQGMGTLYRFDARTCVWFLSALANLGAGTPDIAKQVIGQAVRASGADLSPWRIQRLLWAAGRMGHRSTETTEALADAALPQLSEADAGQREALLQAVVASVEGAEGLPGVQKLAEAVRELDQQDRSDEESSA